METARNKRLDELFADEPHLSPTMKARRLHEKLEAVEKARRIPVAPLLPEPEVNFGLRAVSLVRAAEILRHNANDMAPTDSQTARFVRFRETTLRQWLDDAPELRRGGQAGGGGNLK